MKRAIITNPLLLQSFLKEYKKTRRITHDDMATLLCMSRSQYRHVYNRETTSVPIMTAKRMITLFGEKAEDAFELPHQIIPLETRPTDPSILKDELFHIRISHLERNSQHIRRVLIIFLLVVVAAIAYATIA